MEMASANEGGEGVRLILSIDLPRTDQDDPAVGEIVEQLLATVQHHSHRLAAPARSGRRA